MAPTIDRWLASREEPTDRKALSVATRSTFACKGRTHSQNCTDRGTCLFELADPAPVCKESV